jgi:2-C-methyl-D-erythritol 2,4-cyclodiphosphate synthase
MKILKDNNYEICNIDSTIICEKPNLMSYKKKIQNSLSLIMKINQNKISIKATTHEKLGEIGNNEAIASKSIVLIQKNA